MQIHDCELGRLGYAFSQGFVARPTIAFAEKRGGTRLLLIACCAALSCGRCCAVATSVGV